MKIFIADHVQQYHGPDRFVPALKGQLVRHMPASMQSITGDVPGNAFFAVKKDEHNSDVRARVRTQPGDFQQNAGA